MCHFAVIFNNANLNLVLKRLLSELVAKVQGKLTAQQVIP
jgi:hypothetical protein